MKKMSESTTPFTSDGRTEPTEKISKDTTDWVVLGDHPAALLAGCLLAKEGSSVLFAPLMPSQGVVVAGNGQCLDLESNWILGVGASPIPGLLSDTLDVLSVPATALKWVHEGDAQLPQIVTPRHRFQWKQSDEGLLVELGRERGPKSTPSNESFVEAFHSVERLSLAYFSGFPRSGTEAKRELRARSRTWGRDSREWISTDSIDQLNVDDGWRELLRGLIAGVGFPLESRASVLDTLFKLTLARSGRAFRGGISGYRDFLLRLAVHLGARVALNEEECEALYVEDGRIHSVRLKGQAASSGVVRTQGVILGCASSHAFNMMDWVGSRRKPKLAPGLKPTGWKFTVGLTLRSEGLSEGAGTRTIWFEEGAPALEIEISSPDEYQQTHSEDRLVFLRTEFPFEESTLDAAFMHRMTSRMFKKFCEIHPFAEYHLIRMFPDYRDRSEAESDALAEVYGFLSTQMIPDNLRTYSERGSGCVTSIPNLYVANGESQPQLGSLGSVLIAQEIAKRVRLEKLKNQLQHRGTGPEARL